MTVFGELGEFLKDAKGSIQDVKWIFDDIKGKSIAKQSSAATLQFPVIISRSINVDTASNVVKALERQYATYIQMVISLHPILDLKEDDIPSFINKLHQNNPSTLDLIESCINVYSDNALGIRMFTSINEGCNGPILRSNKEQMFCIEDCLNQVKLNDIFKPEQITLEKANASLDYYVLAEAKKRAKNGGRTTLKGLDSFQQAYDMLQQGKNPQPNVDGPSVNPTSGGGGVVNQPVANQQPNANGATVAGSTKLTAQEPKIGNHISISKEPEFGKGVNTAPHRDAIEPDFNEGIKKGSKIDKGTTSEVEPHFNKNINTNNKANAHEKNKLSEEERRQQEIDRVQFGRELDRANADYRSRAIVKLHDNDIKKCNELVPTTLSVTLQQIKGDTFGGNVNFILGVKGLMHPVNSDDMVSNLLDGYKAGNKFFNFLRWTSGEIAFLRDLIMNVDGIKEDALKKHRKGNSHWWTTLKRNRVLARTKNVFSKNKILPNATIACSMEEVMEIKDTYNVDLLDPKSIMKLMDRYFLLGFVIVDESQELCYFMFDGEREFQALSFKGLERENNNKNDFKDIYKMINSGRL